VELKMANGRGPLEKALTTPLSDFDVGTSNPRKLGETTGEADILVSCRGCGVVFARSKIAKGEGIVPVRPDSKEVICPTTTCPCCLQTQGWREIADVRFRSVDTT
jgi:hypothetical protein